MGGSGELFSASCTEKPDGDVQRSVSAPGPWQALIKDWGWAKRDFRMEIAESGLMIGGSLSGLSKLKIREQGIPI